MFSQIWEQFCAHRKELLERIHRLESYLTAFPYLPCVPALYQQFEQYKAEITRLKKETDRRRRRKVLAINPKDWRRWEERNRRLVESGLSNCPEVLVANARQLVEEARLPSITALLEFDAETEACLLPLEQKREAAFAALEQKKLGIANQLTEARSELVQHEKDVISWAATDVEQLAFFMTVNKHRALTALDEFRKLHPDVNVNHLDSRLKPVSQPSYSQRPIRESKPQEPELAHDERAVALPPELPWKFVMANDTATDFVELPSNEAEAVSIIRDRMQAAEVRPVTPTMVLDKLRHTTRLTAHERSRFKRSFDTPPIGWKLLRLGEYRIFLDIDEASRIITFLVRQRSNAYVMKGHTRSR